MPTFAKMQKMFKDKNVKLVEISTTFFKKTPIALINMVVVVTKIQK
jgi:aromatic ring-opening dioxygenase catalytic subunit (LigB family)